jgi:hypothetical protein
MIQDLKELDEAHKWQVNLAPENIRGKHGGHNKINFEVSYEGLMEFLMSKPKFKELRRYYVKCEGVMFQIWDWIFKQSQ